MLFVLVIVGIDRRLIVTINVTSRPTDAWIARQVTEAFPWEWVPKYPLRDRDSATVRCSRGAFAPWESETDQLHPARHGKIVTQSGSLARSVANVSTTSSRSGRRIYDEFSRNIPTTTTGRAL